MEAKNAPSSAPTVNWEGKTREEWMSDWFQRTEDIRQKHPDVDFRGAVMEPTISLTFAIEERLDEDARHRYNHLMQRMLENTSNPTVAEAYLWEARSCLQPHYDVVKQFDAVFVEKQPIPKMIQQLHECLSMQRGMSRR